MAIPFFSIDLTAKDYLIIVMNIFFPFNKKKVEDKFKVVLSDRYPNKFISLMPSGRLGFYLTMKFLFKENDLILFSSMSFPLYVKIARQLKLRVKLIDVSENDLIINYENLKNIEEDCKGLVITHLFGFPCQIEKILEICKKKNIKMIEDCAQSFGSKFNGIETGNFGEAGIISTSLLKTPTTLSGGFLVTENKILHNEVERWLEKELSNNFFDKFKLFIKIVVFLLNSYPRVYSILSDKIFFFLKKYQPRTYRKILYSGMGMKNVTFDPKERPKLSKFQISMGLSQLHRCEEMKLKRRRNSQYLQSKLVNSKKIKVINDHFSSNWNHQYFVIKINKDFDKIFNKIFENGVHIMDENVWDCSKYNFKIENKEKDFEVGRKYDGSLIRIQNNSFLKIKEIDKIASIIIKTCDEI